MVDGRKRVRRGVHRPINEWDVLIKDHHSAYISWDEFERNVKAIANNATGMSSARARAKRMDRWVGEAPHTSMQRTRLHPAEPA